MGSLFPPFIGEQIDGGRLKSLPSSQVAETSFTCTALTVMFLTSVTDCPRDPPPPMCSACPCVFPQLSHYLTKCLSHSLTAFFLTTARVAVPSTVLDINRVGAPNGPLPYPGHEADLSSSASFPSSPVLGSWASSWDTLWTRLSRSFLAWSPGG